MKLIDKDEFRQKHISGWTRALRQLKPDDISDERELPLPEYYETAVKAAVKAGWFEDADDPTTVEDMRPGEVNKLGRQVWNLFQEFQNAGADPN